MDDYANIKLSLNLNLKKQKNKYSKMRVNHTYFLRWLLSLDCQPINVLLNFGIFFRFDRSRRKIVLRTILPEKKDFP